MEGNQNASRNQNINMSAGIFPAHALPYPGRGPVSMDGRDGSHSFHRQFQLRSTSVRHSPSLIIRTGFFSPAAPSAVKQSFIEQPAAIMPEPARDSQLIANNSGPTLVPDAPQETTVVVNSIAQRPIKPLPCVGSSCNHVSHHRFNDPRHVHQRPFGAGTPTSILGVQSSRR